MSFKFGQIPKYHYLVGKNIKLTKFTKMPLLGWKKYKIAQIYNFTIGPFDFGLFELLIIN
jgi:hypothetical protein